MFIFTLSSNMHKLNPLTQNNLTLQFSQEKKSNNRSLSTIMICFTINFTAPVLYIALLSLTFLLKHSLRLRDRSIDFGTLQLTVNDVWENNTIYLKRVSFNSEILKYWWFSNIEYRTVSVNNGFDIINNVTSVESQEANTSFELMYREKKGL